MRIMADKVHPDEPCWGYFTGPKQMPGYSEEENPRMLEQVFVIRGDAIACYEQDFGPADSFIYVPPMIIPSWGENTVAQLQDMGERHRHDPKWARRIIEYKESSTLFADVIRQEEQRHELIRNRSQFGPAGNFQRDGWSRSTAWRRWADERAKRTGKRQFST